MFHVCLYYTVLSVPCSLVIPCGEGADHLTLLCVIFSCVFVTFPYGFSGQVWYLIETIPDLCLLYFLGTEYDKEYGFFSPLSLFLILKAPPIICRRRQFQILPLFQKYQIRHDISWESYAGRRFSWNIIPYFFSKIGKDVAKFVVTCSCDWRFKFTNLRCNKLIFKVSGPGIIMPP